MGLFGAIFRGRPPVYLWHIGGLYTGGRRWLCGCGMGGGPGLCGWVGGVFFVDECYGGVDGCAEDLADGPGACDEEDG